MIGESPIPAAQYLRVSTEHQQYSLQNQRNAIHAFAAKMGFMVVRTYADEGKSGLMLKQRGALQNLLSDVASGKSDFQAVLVYDVSRWGRFQDADEAAHYEFLCRVAGVQVHYCAEQFTSDPSIPNALMKSLKRVMAGEYSRELSVKVHHGLKRVAESGFRTGGEAGYGLRRMLVSSTRQLKGPLSKGERKSLQSDHVILVPGPNEEVECVREIFHKFVKERKWPKRIATELRDRGIPYRGTRRAEWYPEAITRILKNPKYCGCSVFGRSSFFLRTHRVHYLPDLWMIKSGAWQSIVDKEMFEEAQARFQSQTRRKKDSELLASLQRLLKERGALSQQLVCQSPELPSAAPYVRRFGSLSEAFERVGYITSQLATIQTKRCIRSLRDRIVDHISASDPTRIKLFQPDRRYRPKFRIGGELISLFVCRCVSRAEGPLIWCLNTAPRKTGCISLIVTLTSDNTEAMDMFVVPTLPSRSRYNFGLEDPCVLQGKRLLKIADIFECVHSMKTKA